MTTKIVLNSAGVRALLHEPGVVADLTARAQRVAAAAGTDLQDPEGMAVVVDTTGATRARARVLTITAEAMEAEAKDRRLTRAIDVAR